MNLFELTLKLKGLPIAEARQRLMEIHQVPETDYTLYSDKMRRDIYEYHLRENTFYANFVNNYAFSSWEEIPIMQKKQLQVPLEERLANGFHRKNTHVAQTSGSSGVPLVFAKDNFCHALTWAIHFNRFGWLGIDLNQHKQARFYGIPLGFKSYQKERIKDWLSNRFRFPIFDLSEKKLAAFLNVFRRKKFDYINGHTSSIVLFAKYLKAKNIVLTNVCPTLKYCVATSEMLFPNDKMLLEKQLGVPVANEYGASELDLIAFTDREGTFRVNSESLYVEIVDENDKTVPFGEVGRVIVTALFNKAHPFIRYEVGDLGVISIDSSSKQPILQKLVGRANDNAVLPDGKTVPGHTFYYVAKSALEENGNVKEFMMEQKELTVFNIIYVSDVELSHHEKDKLRNALFQYLEKNLTLHFERVSVLDRSNRGKLKQFISKL